MTPDLRDVPKMRQCDKHRLFYAQDQCIYCVVEKAEEEDRKRVEG